LIAAAAEDDLEEVEVGRGPAAGEPLRLEDDEHVLVAGQQAAKAVAVGSKLTQK
jgi:hypothetical protein